ncbi:MAG: transposase [Candidatus Omnitrophica bacterium]|nr:transposase [Candidatus Omnitrophota bacterium]
MNHKRKDNDFLLDYLDGKPLRKIADKSNCCAATALAKCNKQLRELPHNNDVTKRFCDRFCGILVVDGKYIAVKGYEKKIPLLWGLDYLSHDIPVYRLAPSESYQSWLKYFGYLKSMRYPMKMVVCDDNKNIQLAAKYIFPNVLIQLCHNHFMENIRRELHTRTDPTYQRFVWELKEQLFKRKIMIETFRKRSYKLFKKYAKDERIVKQLLKINEYTQELTAANYLRKAPRTTNIIESYNSHLQGRLKTIKGFQSFQSADQWLNGYILRRRIKKFTDCCNKFRYLNGKNSLSKTCKRDFKKQGVLPLFT